MELKYYIAYGSNLNIEQMSKRCPNAKLIGTATISDYELMFKGMSDSAYLTIEKKENKNVPVGIWLVDKNDELALDKYEDYPKLYYKKNMKLNMQRISSKQIEAIDAFVYVMYEDRAFNMPSDDYLEICLKGYIDVGFDRKSIDEALELTKSKI